MVSEKQVLKVLNEIIDPELGVGIVDLGFIYGVKVEKGFAEIRMTLTTIGCPLAGWFAMQVEQKVKEIKGVKDVHVHVVWEPAWSIDMMSKKAKLQLGLK
ncbi:metal-sulfur cluster assembly factor [Candidatus Micrarchaeota archaeon]|nr:metal-sulfur cluster assembly factor [Candidatus Micrarchaeota archaeon]